MKKIALAFVLMLTACSPQSEAQKEQAAYNDRIRLANTCLEEHDQNCERFLDNMPHSPAN